MKEKIREYYHIENTSVYESTVKKDCTPLCKARRSDAERLGGSSQALD